MNSRGLGKVTLSHHLLVRPCCGWHGHIHLSGITGRPSPAQSACRLLAQAKEINGPTESRALIGILTALLPPLRLPLLFQTPRTVFRVPVLSERQLLEACFDAPLRSD